MSRQTVARHYSRLLSRWPVDLLRPEERSFQHLIRKRIQVAPTGHANEQVEVNSAYLLVDDVFAKQYPLPEVMMKPRSNPNHYSDLARELREAPNQTWWGNLVKRIRNSVRFQ